MKIRSAVFVVSNQDVAKCPQSDLPEYAFIGRSNVGKSSLINMLTGNKGLAKTSSMPGKTLLINHFLINNEWHLVDLPGYGYARRGKDQRQQLERIIRGYIMVRKQMVNLFVLVDGRHKPQQIDLDFMQWLGETRVPFSIVFTKLDKLGRQAAIDSVEAYKRVLLETWEELPPTFLTSSMDGRGREELLDYIDQINRSLKE